ncbi:MAG: DUF1501 domain-containing protein [Lentisphaeria bacterium]|nr:DUF1501 domain-containing protein [Lentisphaeria bacterium]
MKTVQQDKLNRRNFLKMGAWTTLGLLMSGKAHAQQKKPKQKSVIEIWLWGGSSHIDTFDPKPKAGKDYTGPLDKVIQTNAPNIQLNASLPLLAKEADKFSIIRSMTHGIFAHETASYVMRTGHSPKQGIVYPSVGAVISKLKGNSKDYKCTLPPYIVLTQPQGRFSESGFLDQKYKPFATGGNPTKTPFTVSGIVAGQITDERQEDRQDLLKDLDTLNKSCPDNELFDLANKETDRAYEMILGEDRKVFDLTQESDDVRDRYGRTVFGQSCLVARRLVEKGVLYITINVKGWDTHKQHFNSMNRMLPDLDRGLSALLADLDKSKLLDTTIVTCTGEFGRGPKVQWNEPWNGGRSHYGHCFSALVAGGGFVGGQVVGETNATAERVTKRPVTPQDFIGSIYHLLGIDSSAKLENKRGLDVTILPPSKGGGILKEIMRSV